MSRRDQIKMTDEEVRRLLEEGRDLHIATVGPDGAPHLVTMWYGLVDGQIGFWTYSKSQKVRNLERDSRITVLVSAGDQYSNLRGVQIKGRAHIRRDPDDVVAVGERVHARNATNFGEVRAADGRFEMDEGTREVLRQMSQKRVAVIVEPEEVVSWDHRKLGGVY